MSEVQAIEITGRESELILEYGHPFPEQAEILRAVAGKAGYHSVSIGRFWLENILADLSRSMRELDDDSLLEELDGLCTVIETAMQS